MKKFISVLMALVMALSLTTMAWGAPTAANCANGATCTDHEAAIGADHYDTLVNAVADATAGATITLLKDVTGPVTIDKSVTLDLNGHTISNDGTGYETISVDTANVVLTINDSVGTGKVTSDAAYGAIYVANSGTGKVTINGGTFESTSAGYAACVDLNGTMIVNGGTLTASDFGVTIFGPNAALTVNGGKITATGAESWAISGSAEVDPSGNELYGGTTITINGGTISGTELGIYHPQTGTLTISGDATVSGATGVYVKSGTVSVTGGSISGTDDALVIDSCNYPGGAPVVSVTGGTFASTSGAAVASYANSGVTTPVTGFVEGGTFDGAVAMDEDLLTADTALTQDTNGNWVAGAAVTMGDKFDLYLADSNMNTALKLKTPTVAGLSFDEVGAKTNKDGSGRVAYIAANNGQYFVKTATPTVADYAVTDAGKTTVLYYVTVAGTSAANFEYAEAVTAFTNFSTYAKCGYVTGTPVAGKTYFEAADGLVYMAGAAGTDTNYLLNGKVVSGTYAGTPEEHTFVFNGYQYNSTLKKNVPTSALCTKCMMTTGSIYLKTKVPATYTIYPTTGEGSVDYTVALANAATGVYVPSAGTTTDTKVESAQTFDAGIAMYVGMSVLAATGSAVVIGKKRED